MSTAASYVGRFAPSPTGPLHFGSLLTALASFLDARKNSGKWLIRMEDLDTPRTSQQAASEIKRTLEHYGLLWDGEILWQHRRRQVAYEKALQQLDRLDLTYPCTCSRREIQGIYPGNCRDKAFANFQSDTIHRTQYATRIRTDARLIHLSDRILGSHSWCLEEISGDFVIRRKDTLFSYQLAVVIDDAEQDVTHVVRGADLLESTPRQIYLQQLLGLSTPLYAHIPIVTSADGSKLSKQTGALPLTLGNPFPALKKAISMLGQSIPPADVETHLEDWLEWAADHWDISDVPQIFALPAN